MEMKAFMAAELTVLGAFAIYLVFAQLDHMKKLKARDRAEAEAANRPVADQKPGAS